MSLKSFYCSGILSGIVASAIVLFPQAVHSAEPMRMGRLVFSQPQETTVAYGGWIEPQGNGVQQHNFSVQVTVHKDELDTISVSTRGSTLHFGEQQVLSGTGTAVPIDLSSVELGSQYSHRLKDDRIIGGRFGVGSASDHPFANSNVSTVSLSGYYSFPGSEQSRWFLTLFYSNNNPINDYAPIPGFIYLYRTESFTGMFGIPFASIQWLPAESWTISLAAFGPTVNSEVAYGSQRGIQGFTGFSWSQQMFLREDRPNKDDRLYFVEKRAVLGTRFPLWSGLISEIQGGYAFNRSIYEGSRFDRKNEGSADLGDSLYIGWNLKLGL